ncbi:rho GTPase-activating protein 31 isoform X2 [Amia ocellicauda]|uniref:rho GTPase-activating protein 31 isoform X2 n=1 Tax=Amia ocellicauda TaxID=2972642 RepID=UPI0034646EA4
MKNKAAKQKSKRKGSLSAFGCDLTEYLQTSGQDVPHVLKSCAEFIEEHGIVDGIYRLSGITSNIQRLRQEFGTDPCPDLTREVYLQDIHCVGSLCKLYFRELPNPLLTYDLYKKFTDAVSAKNEHEQLQRIQDVIKELPASHYRTLEYLTKHLRHLASYSTETNMHARNLALVWAPNLLRSKEIEVSKCNGDAAFMEVRVQQTVVEFILNHMEQIFSISGCTSSSSPPKVENDERSLEGGCPALLVSSQCAPMKLVSLEEAQARSLSPNHPARRERQRENSLPDASTTTLYHTVIDLPDSKKFSGKSKKWKSIFNLGRTMTETKGKLSRNGSVFVRGQKLSEKATIRPAKSMDSLCSLPTEDDDKDSEFKRPAGTGGFIMPAFKSRTLGSGSTFDLSKRDHEWDYELERSSGAMGGGSPGSHGQSEARVGSRSSTPQQKQLPEQLKVFKGDDLGRCEPTSPKTRRMFYSTSASDGSTKPTFPGSLFPLESSPRHQRKALNISEPFAVSVPLRVSAVISSNSTPCRAPGKDKQDKQSLPSVSEVALLRSGNEGTLSEQGRSGSSSSGCSSASSNSSVSLKKDEKSVMVTNSGEEVNTSMDVAEGHNPEPREGRTREDIEKSPPVRVQQPPSLPTLHPVSPVLSTDSAVRGEPLPMAKPSGLLVTDLVKPETQLDNLMKQNQKLSRLSELDEESTTNAAMDELWPDIHLELKIVEPDVDIIDDKFESVPLFTHNTKDEVQQKPDPHAKRRSSFPTYPLLSCGQVSLAEKALKTDPHNGSASFGGISDRRLSFDTSFNPKADVRKQKAGTEYKVSTKPMDGTGNELPVQPKDTEKILCPSTELPPAVICGASATRRRGSEPGPEGISKVGEMNVLIKPSSPKDIAGKCEKQKEAPRLPQTGESKDFSVELRRSIFRLSKQMEERPQSLDLNERDEEDMWGDNAGALELVEPWEDYSTTKQWVTSPLHSPKGIDFLQMPEGVPSCENRENIFFNKPQNSGASAPGKEGLKELCLTGVKKDSTDDSSPGNIDLQDCKPTSIISVQAEEPLLPPIASPHQVDVQKHNGMQPEKKQLATSKDHLTFEKPAKPESENKESLKQEITTTSQRPNLKEMHKLKSLDGLESDTQKENVVLKHRPSSLNLDLASPFGNTYVKDGSDNPFKWSTDVFSAETALAKRGSVTPSETKTSEESVGKIKYSTSSIELDMFLTDRQAPVRRNSAPVSVSSVRTSFMIKTCQAKAVPVIPPKIQYTQIPQPLQVKNSESLSEKDPEKPSSNSKKEQDPPQSPPFTRDPKDSEKENNEPSPKTSRQAGSYASVEMPLSKSTTPTDPPVLRRKRSSNGEAFLDSRLDRSPGLQKPSYRARPTRPQSLILFSPPFPIMDYPSTGEGGKLLLSPIKSPTDTAVLDSLCKELPENLKTPEGVTLRSKMSMPKSGQRLETSTSCFYQPQRRSMIFDSRSSRQIE